MVKDTKQMKKTIWHAVLPLHMQFTRRNYQWRSYARKRPYLLVRRLDEAATKKAMKPLFQIEHEWEFSRESSGTQTKDGVANAVSGLKLRYR